ncbi:MAG: efflux RND transporter periplasmic adaptor subunit [Desulfovibrio sp.]|jgi:Cu(I)/Ag(I) efflux system membrane fusion protein|nr:efflux RND transporter periplasmic adaptor subunit [Desulfovibrio sp.]
MLLRKILPAVFCLMVGAGAGYLARPHLAPALKDQATHGQTDKGERKVLYWYDPMYPGTHFDKPGPSPFMDMDLVPRYASEGAGAGIRIDPAQVQNLAVRTRKVERGNLVFSRDIPANVEFNDYQLARVQPRAEGFVESALSWAVGDVVAAGDALADITVPGWAADQSEYLLLKAQKADAVLVRGVWERMRLAGIPEKMLKALEATGKVQTRMTVHAPISGVLTGFDVYPGMNVNKGMTIATIQGTNPVWVSADVPERDIHLVTKDKRIRVTAAAWPDKVFYAQSFTLLPRADKGTRTVPLRLTLDNPDGLLKPGMTATIRLRGADEETLLIPTQSLIDLGEEQRVIVRLADGSFAPRQVHVLRSSREKTAVASGVEPGEEVVVTGLFLIDSEANLQGALNRMRRDNAQDHTRHTVEESQ